MADLERLEEGTRLEGESELAWAERMLVASAGAVLGNAETGDRIEVPTLALRSTTKGACVHYRKGRCSIYSARPSACSAFDCSQTDAEAQALGLPMHHGRLRAWEGSRYALLWEHLSSLGRTRSRANLDKRRRKVDRAG